MSVPAVIATAAENYRFNAGLLEKIVADLSPEEWLKHPADHVNPVAWIVGHLLWTRGRLLGRVGTQWEQPWVGVFARGTKLQDVKEFPAPEKLLNAWRESSALVESALQNVSEETLAQPAPQGPPSADGKISGVVNFLATHETYHIGQASLLRAWMGHKGLLG